MAGKFNIAKYEPLMPMLFVRFYLVGLILFMLPFTRGLFISITAASLFLVIAAVLLFHTSWNTKTVLWFLFIVISSFLMESFGVRTGALFGQYTYERGLAPMIDHTPVIIGFNWLFLVYASHNIVDRFNLRPWSRILCGSLLMIGYDVVLEWIAPFMQMWHFDSGYPPLRNFIVWFLAALLYHCGFEVLKIRSDNPPARILFGLQILFFLLIGLFSILILK